MKNNGFDGELFQSVTHGELKASEVVSLIKDFLEDEPLSSYSLVIGTYSHEKNVKKSYYHSFRW